MELSELKVGDKVLVYINANNSLVGYTSVTNHTSQVTVVAKTHRVVTIAWTTSDKIPFSPEIHHDASYIGYIAWMAASPHRLFLPIAQTDGPCRQCSKINSADVKRCWWCQVSYPTDLKRIGP